MIRKGGSSSKCIFHLLYCYEYTWCLFVHLADNRSAAATRCSTSDRSRSPSWPQCGSWLWPRCTSCSTADAKATQCWCVTCQGKLLPTKLCFNCSIPCYVKLNCCTKPVFLQKKALAKIKAQGGMKKEDPNAVKKLKSPEFQNKVKKRVADDAGREKTTIESSTSS